MFFHVLNMAVWYFNLNAALHKFNIDLYVVEK